MRYYKLTVQLLSNSRYSYYTSDDQALALPSISILALHLFLVLFWISGQEVHHPFQAAALVIFPAHH